MTKVELDSNDLAAILDLIRDRTKPSPIEKLYKFNLARSGLDELKSMLTAAQWDKIRESVVRELTEDA